MSSHAVPSLEAFEALERRVLQLEARLTARAEPEWLTLADAATYIGRSKDATYKLVTRLRLKHQEVPRGRIQIRRTELDTALTTQEPT